MPLTNDSTSAVGQFRRMRPPVVGHCAEFHDLFDPSRTALDAAAQTQFALMQTIASRRMRQTRCWGTPIEAPLRRGKFADVIVLDKDPSIQIENADTIAAVWHLGRQVSGGVGSFKP